MSTYDVAVVGAGPYGLSVAAHLREQSFKVTVFGRPMSFWDRNMPLGMLLRSPRQASNLSDPEGKLTLETYLDGSVGGPSNPTPRDRFVNYGIWFQQKAVPDVDTRNVASLRKEGEFRLALEDGEEVKASRVIVAAGIGSFAERPPQFAGLPKALVSHAVEHRDFAPFKNRRVAVIGAGQSAIENAALLHEAGAEVELLVRSPRIKWLRARKGLTGLTSVKRMLWAPTDVGPAGISQLIARPNYYRRMPRFMQTCFGALPPAGSAWLRPRIENKVPINLGCEVTSAKRFGDQLELTVKHGRQHRVDHVLLATGYRVDISRYEFIEPRLLAAVATINGYPRLNSRFECSTPGLHFMGAPAAWSFGPLMKFVAGAGFAAKTATRGILAVGKYAQSATWNTASQPGFEAQDAGLR